MKSLDVDILPVVVLVVFLIISIFSGHKNAKTTKSEHVG